MADNSVPALPDMGPNFFLAQQAQSKINSEISFNFKVFFIDLHAQREKKMKKKKRVICGKQSMNCNT